MPAVAPELLSLIAKPTIEDSDLAWFEAAISGLRQLAGSSEPALRRSMLSAMVRALETRILGDRRLLAVATHWRSVRGRVEEEISQRVERITGSSPPPEVVDYLKRCLHGLASNRDNPQRRTRAYEWDLLSAAVEGSEERQLRCCLCGYHFRRQDLTDRRLGLAEELEATFAEAFHSLRHDDRLKPPDFTALQIDHMTPVLGLGWTALDNLQVCCEFCNQGKLSFRRSLEPISTLVAGSLSAVRPIRKHQFIRQVIVVAALIDAERHCSKCRRSVGEAELSAVMRSEIADDVRWLVPWNLAVQCYDCIAESRIDVAESTG